MTLPDRPDLASTPPEVIAYINSLEAELARLQAAEPAAEADQPAAPLEPSEPPTTINLITISAIGLAKRTPRHLYDRQRRGGMGIFDLETGDDDRPALLTALDEAHDLIVLTTEARAFRVAASRLASQPVRARGQALLRDESLHPNEAIAAVLPAGRGAALALLSASGYARVLPAHVVGPAMNPGTSLYRFADFGPLAGACWTSGAGDLFVATERGVAIRFPERGLPLPGGLAIRLEAGDRAAAVEGVRPPDGESIFLLGADGRGTIRLMAGFAANKAPGGGGKIALKTDRLIAALAVQPQDDLFLISRLGKIIRFRADEVPPKEGVVQGVNCMALRGDECVAATASGPAAT
jgi:DNA gyrase subunit A